MRERKLELLTYWELSRLITDRPKISPAASRFITLLISSRGWLFISE
jgi:hypothetical protein